MIPKTSPLPSDQFQARGYQTIKSPYFSLKVKNNNSVKIRTGIVVGKSIHKTAVRRNFWKRQGRSVLTPLLKPGNDIILIFYPSVNNLTRLQFRKEFTQTIKAYK